MTPEEFSYKVFKASSEFYDSLPEPKPTFTRFYYGDGAIYDAVQKVIRGSHEEHQDKQSDR